MISEMICQRFLVFTTYFLAFFFLLIPKISRQTYCSKTLAILEEIFEENYNSWNLMHSNLLMNHWLTQNSVLSKRWAWNEKFARKKFLMTPALIIKWTEPLVLNLRDTLFIKFLLLSLTNQMPVKLYFCSLTVPYHFELDFVMV